MVLVNGNITPQNINNICRLCLEEKQSTYKLSMIVKFQDCPIKPSSISDLIAKISPQEIRENDIFKNLQLNIICHDCFNELKLAYLFILKYEEANSLLLSFYENLKTVKDEDCDIAGSDTDPSPPYTTRSSKRRTPRRRRLEKQITEDFESKSRPDVLHPCPICTKEFTALDLRDHAHTHKALGKYLKIPDEHKVSPTTKFVSRGLSTTVSIFNRDHKLHKCPYCNQEFEAVALRVHIEVHRMQAEFSCDTCGRVFRKLNHLNTHRVKHLKEYPYKCEQCGKGFVIKRNFDCHVLTHTSGELPHECSFCFRRFSNPEHLNRHQIIHTENVTYSVKYRVCKCLRCLRTFKDKDEMQGHECTPVERSGAGRYPCKACHKVFKHSSGLYNHNRIIHKLKGAKTLCSVCGVRVSNIYHHMMRHSGEKPFKCDQCEKRFASKPQLKQHLLVHSGLKPYVCSVCAKAFNNLYNLQVHERIHKGDRCHICPVCNKGFLEKSYLKKHMNIHNKVP